MVRTSRPARSAAVLVLVAGGALFIYTFIGMTTYFQKPAWELLFTNPVGGSTLFDSLVFFTIPVLLQAAVAFALDRRAVWPRVIGTVVAFAIVAACALWLVFALAAGVVWVLGGMPTQGRMPAGGDFMDLTGVAIAVPVVAAIGYLNLRAALLTLRTLRAR